MSDGEKRDSSGFDGADDDLSSKPRRRNMEQHLAAERDRRKMTRRKLIELDKLLPGYKTGPRTLNQCLKLATEHVSAILGKTASDDNAPAGSSSIMACVMYSAPALGVAILDARHQIVQSNPALREAAGLQPGGNGSQGMSFLSLLTSASQGVKEGSVYELRFAQGTGSVCRVDVIAVSGAQGRLNLLLVYLPPRAHTALPAFPGGGNPLFSIPGFQAGGGMGHAMSVQAGFSATMGTSSTMDQSVVGGGMVGGGFGKGVGMGGGGFGGSAGMLSGGFGSAGGGFGDSGVGNGMGQSTMGGGGAGGGVGRIVGQLAEFSGAGTGAGALQMPRSGGFGFGFPAVSGGMVSMGGPGIVPPARPKLAVDIANLSFFAGLEPQVILELAKVARPFFASAGAVIVSAGIAGAGLYAVEAGKCAAFVSGLQVETIRPGMVFGESNILLGKSQQDVLAIENSAVLEFPYAPLLQIMYGSPGLRAALLMAVHQRSVMTAAASASVGMPSNYPAQESQTKVDAAPPAGNAAALVAEFSGAMGWPQSRQEGFVRQDTLSNLLGDISSAHDSNPWAKDYAGGVLSDLRDWRTQQLKYNGTPGSNKGSNCSMDSFLHGLGNHDPPDFSRHLVRSRTESRHGTPDPVDRSTLGVHVSRVRESALLLADCSAACLQDIAKLCGSMTAKAGEQLIQTQSIVRYMYLLEAGSVVIIVDGQTIRQLGPGDVFGEIGTLFAEVSTAEAHVLEDSQLLRIAAKDLHSLLSAYPELYMTLKHQCLVNLRRACSGPPPAGLLEAEPAAVARLKKLSQNTNGTHSLADLANRRLVPAGEKIVSVEKDAATLLVLDQGIVHMEREGSVVSALYPGDLIGELGTMISKKHLYDARAATCVEVLEIRASDLETVLTQNPSLRVHLIQLGAQAMARDQLLRCLHAPRAINSSVQTLVRMLGELDTLLHQVLLLHQAPALHARGGSGGLPRFEKRRAFKLAEEGADLASVRELVDQMRPVINAPPPELHAVPR